jgi:hypothetical protein
MDEKLLNKPKLNKMRSVITFIILAGFFPLTSYIRPWIHNFVFDLEIVYSSDRVFFALESIAPWSRLIIFIAIILLLFFKYYKSRLTIYVGVLIIFIWLVIISQTQSKGSLDGAIKGNLAGLRRTSELYFDEHGIYGEGNVAAEKSMGACSTPKTVFDPDLGNSVFDGVQAASAAYRRGWHATCALDADIQAWAVSVPSRFYKGKKFWCVDSTGKSTEVSRHITEARCPSE